MSPSSSGLESETPAALCARSVEDAVREGRKAEEMVGVNAAISAQCRGLCEALSVQLENCAAGRTVNLDDIRECAAEVRRLAVCVQVNHVGAEVDKIRRRIGENLLHARFADYENFFLQLSIGAELAEKSGDSPAAREALAEWGRRHWEDLEASHAKLRIAEKPLLQEKLKNWHDRARPWTVAILTLIIGALVALAVESVV